MEKESGDWCRNKQTHKQERVGVIEGGHRSQLGSLTWQPFIRPANVPGDNSAVNQDNGCVRKDQSNPVK